MLISLGERPISLILWGPSRLGKTVWARSLGRHLFFPGLYSGEEAYQMQDESIQYAVFDDIAGGLKFFPNYKAWFGGQRQMNVKKLFHDPKLMTWGRPVIWLCNDYPLTDLSDSEVAWFEANTVMVNITEKFVVVKDEESDSLFVQE